MFENVAGALMTMTVLLIAWLADFGCLDASRQEEIRERGV
jgi:hypothetical protein